VTISSPVRTLILLTILSGVLIWNYNRPPDSKPTPETQRQLPKVTPPAEIGSEESEVGQIPAPQTPPTPAAVAEPATARPATPQVLPGSVPENPETAIDISEDLTAVDSAIRNYQAVYGENPVGSNAEITTALFINNPKQIKLEVPTGSQINAEGQLCDRWDTPYFFHQVSKTEMEIRSAGPDRQMWTGDDAQM
jgi:hypothetical protein